MKNWVILFHALELLLKKLTFGPCWTGLGIERKQDWNDLLQAMSIGDHEAAKQVRVRTFLYYLNNI